MIYPSILQHDFVVSPIETLYVMGEGETVRFIWNKIYLRKSGPDNCGSWLNNVWLSVASTPGARQLERRTCIEGEPDKVWNCENYLEPTSANWMQLSSLLPAPNVSEIGNLQEKLAPLFRDLSIKDVWRTNSFEDGWSLLPGKTVYLFADQYNKDTVFFRCRGWDSLLIPPPKV